MKKGLIVAGIIVIVLAVLIYGGYTLSRSRDTQLFGEIVTHVETDQKVVALTFDDGPTALSPEILDMLEELDIKCTFFLTGHEMEKNMGYAKDIAAAGHQIANHSYSHKRMVLKSVSFIENEIETTNNLIRQAGYTGEIYFRAPFCKKFILLPLALQQRGMVSITWDVEPDSYNEVKLSADNISQYTIDNAKNGSIILLHIMYDANENARLAIPDIVSGLREKGYTFVTVDELMQLRGQDESELLVSENTQ